MVYTVTLNSLDYIISLQGFQMERLIEPKKNKCFREGKELMFPQYFKIWG